MKRLQIHRRGPMSILKKWAFFSLIVMVLPMSGCGRIKISLEPPGGSAAPYLVGMRITPGYGLDANHNGIVDMPNSVAYVQRPLTITLDAKPLAMLYPNRWPVPDGQDPGLGDLRGPWRWTFTKVDVRQDISLLPVPASSLPQVPGVRGAEELVAYTDTPALEIGLFEGQWSLEFARVDLEDPSNTAIYRKTVPLRVEDYLIVQLGDSYSSGEGAPELQSVDGEWGDDGTLAGYPISRPDYSPCLNMDLRGLSRCVIRAAYGTDINFEHELAHRSSKTWGSIAAQNIEDYSGSTSVTFINLAASGAKLEQLYKDYQDPI